MKLLPISLLLFQLLSAAAAVVTVTPAPRTGNPELLLKPGNTVDFTFPAFTEKVVLEIRPEKTAWLRRVTLEADAVPAANFSAALVEVENEAGSWVPVDSLEPPNEQVKRLYRVSGKPLSVKTGRIRITLTPPFIESAMSLRSVGLEFSDTPGEAPAARGGIVIGGANTPGFLTRPLAPGRTGGEKLTLTAGFVLPEKRDFDCNLLVQKANTATAFRIALRGREGKRELGYYDRNEFMPLFPLGKENRARITLECDNGNRRFTVSCDGQKSAELPFASALPEIDTVLLSVPASSGEILLDQFRYTLTGKAGLNEKIEVDFADPAEFSRFKHSGRVQRLEPQSDAVRPAESDLLTVESDGRRYEFSRKNGELFGITDLRSGRRLVDSLRTLYSIQVKEGDSSADGLYDRVTEVARTGDGITFRCAAAFDPAVKIEKSYRFSPDELSRTLQFAASGTAFRFVTPAERLVFPAERRNALMLAGGDPWYSPRVRLADVRLATRQTGSGVSHAVAAFEPDGNDSLALLRYRVNGRFVWPVHSAYIYEPGNVVVYHPDGVQLPAATLPLHGGQESSYESKLIFFRGNEMGFLAAYRALPEVKKAYSEIRRPAWTADALAQIWVRPELSGDAVKQVKQLLAMTGRGEIMVVLNQPFLWGDFGETERFRNIWGAWTRDAEYIELIRELKALSPRVKVALYTWIWTVAPDADFCREFPGGVISRNRRGQIFNSYPGVELSFQRQLNDAPGREKLAGQYREMVKKYGVDYVYLDGGKGGAPAINWQNGTVDQDYLWQDFYRYMRGLSEEYGKGGVSFNSKANPIADSGIAEMALDAFRNNAALVGARIWGGKLQEKFDPDHRVIPCYWGKSDPYYSNLCIGLGLLPHIECAGLSPVEPDFITIKSPFLGAMREMLGTAPVRIAPGSMLENPETRVLGFELERGNASFFSLIPEGRQEKPFPLALPGEPRFLWSSDLLNPVGFRDIFTEEQQIAAWKQNRWRLSRTFRHSFLGKREKSVAIPLRENLLTIVSASPSGAVILAVDGLPAQIRTSSLPGITVDSAVSADTLTGKVRSKGEVLEIAAALPEGRAIGSLEGAEFQGLFRENGTAFAILRTRGDFHIALIPAEKRGVTMKAPARVAPGEQVRLFDRLPPYAALTLYLDSQPVMSTPEGGFTVPELARNGRYELKLEDASGTLAAAPMEIAGEKPVPLPRIPRIVRPPATVTPVEHAAIRAVALGGDQDEAADVGKLTLTAKIKERPETLWNYSSAGFEFGNVRYLRFHASSDIATRYCIERRKSWAPAFAGILVDYKVGGKFVQRVAFDLGMTEYRWALPEYGTGRAPDRQLKLGDWIQQEPEKRFSLDLQTYAPAGWNGECIVSALVANVLQGRKLALKLEAFSPDDAGILLAGADPGKTGPESLAGFPEPVAVPGEISDFRELVTLKPALPATRLAIRPEGGSIRFDFTCSEPAFDTVIANAGEWVHNADSVELYFHDPVKRKTLRVAANAGGMLDAGKLPGVTASARMLPEKKEFVISITVPRALLPPGNEWKMNACRNRPRRYDEPANRWTCAAWARLPKGSYDMPEFFGTVRPGADSPQPDTSRTSVKP